ncbi:hypothetical protein ARHIZOSPH14_00450 [Agromyces rhizosphaerae]|uniref:Regulatory protein RecX n=1 Tax=Agromyces rhizosphaerae TaxID=88374 RepID=A0A9W6FQ78_9MICO|nr:regulatory protein RecX [Agromyces rhizosphaerae]GLI25803.1 hypothetical protein ARHIZOSPH14_00450 [Agromyces rhizosphaerae]
MTRSTRSGRSDRDDDAIAPVAYLPWVRPGQEAAPAEPSQVPASGSRSELWGAVPGSEMSDCERVEERLAATPAMDDDRVDRVVLARLRRSSLSVAEVRRLLREQDVPAEDVDAWIDRYERLGYLDDRSFADQLAASLVERKGYGAGAVLAELQRRGIEPGLARETVDALDGDDERSRAIELAAERARRMGSLDRMTAVRRLSGYLQRRGYSGDVVREAVDAALDGAHV